MNKSLANWLRSVLVIASAILALWIPRFFIDTAQHQQYYQVVILTLTLLAILWYSWETRSMQKAVRDQAAAATRQIAEIIKQTEAVSEQTQIAALQIHEVVAQTQAVKNQTEAIAGQTQELIYHRRLSILPKLSIGFTRQNVFYSPHVVECLELRNIGNGAAVNIAIDDIRLKYADNAFARIRFDKFVFLEPNKENSPTDKFAHLHIFIDNEDTAPPDPVEFATWSVPLDYRDNPSAFFRAQTKEQEITLLVRFQDVDGASYSQSVTMGIEGNNLRPLELGRPIVQSCGDEVRAPSPSVT